MSLKRQGQTNTKATSFGTMDDLVYTYDIGNKLLKVVDNSKGVYGFNDGFTYGSAENDYVYDANGNLMKDANKGLTNITYNHLNLPVTVTMDSGRDLSGTIDYVYDARGVKLAKKTVIKLSTWIMPREKLYAGNYIYEAGVLQYFNHPEGYVKNDNGTFNYVYTYKDHLGSVRLSYSDNNGDGVINPATEIKEEMNYYPFGVQHKGYKNISQGSEYPYKFNGKEYDEQLSLQWHDFGARQYDATIGKWMNLDPLAEQMRRHSPYNYAFDNPVYFIDPDGMAPMDFDWIENPDGTFTAEAGDTIWGLENQQGVEHGIISAINPDLDPTKLQVGQTVNGARMIGGIIAVSNDSPIDETDMIGRVDQATLKDGKEKLRNLMLFVDIALESMDPRWKYLGKAVGVGSPRLNTKTKNNSSIRTTNKAPKTNNTKSKDTKTMSTKSDSKASSKPKTKTVRVKGHYRTSKKGKKFYVKPHDRKIKIKEKDKN